MLRSVRPGMQTSPTIGPFGFADLGELLWRRKLLVSAAVIGALAGGAALTERTLPVYRARARLAVAATRETPVVVNASGVSPAAPEALPGDSLGTRSELLRSREFQQRVRKAAGVAARQGIHPPEILVEEVPRANVIDVIVEGGDREEITRLANRMLEMHLSEEHELRASGPSRVIKLLEDERDRILSELARIERLPSETPVETEREESAAETREVDDPGLVEPLILDSRNRLRELRAERSRTAAALPPGPDPAGTGRASLAVLDRLILGEEERLAALVRRQSAPAETAPAGEGLPDAARIEIMSSRRKLMQDRVLAVESQLREFQSQLTTLQLGARLAEPATVPTDPVRPQPLANLCIAAGLGATLGTLLAALADRRGFTPPASQWRRLQLSLLNPLPPPRISAPQLCAGGEGLPPLLTLAEAGIASERRLLVTGPLSADLLLPLAWEISLCLGALGRRVLLLDAGLARPQPEGELPRPGLARLLCGLASLDEVLIGREAPYPNLLPAGDPPPNPLELLRSPRTRTLLDDLDQRYDHLVIVAPTRPLPEAPAYLASLTGAALILDDSHRMQPRDLALLARTLEARGAHVLGVLPVTTPVRPHSKRLPDSGGVRNAVPEPAGGPSAGAPPGR